MHNLSCSISINWQGQLTSPILLYIIQNSTDIFTRFTKSKMQKLEHWKVVTLNQYLLNLYICLLVVEFRLRWNNWLIYFSSRRFFLNSIFICISAFKSTIRMSYDIFFLYFIIYIGLFLRFIMWFFLSKSICIQFRFSSSYKHINIINMNLWTVKIKCMRYTLMGLSILLIQFSQVYWSVFLNGFCFSEMHFYSNGH